ncbi:MAG: hypothetical protein ACRDT0_14010 [Pseudonocardiaceae bacterium]
MTRIFGVLRGAHHTVLLFAAGTGPSGLLQHAAALEQRYPDLVDARVVCTQPPATTQPRLLHDPASSSSTSTTVPRSNASRTAPSSANHRLELLMIELRRHAEEQRVRAGPAGQLQLLPTQPLATEVELVVFSVEPDLLAALGVGVQPLGAYALVIDEPPIHRSVPPGRSPFQLGDHCLASIFIPVQQGTYRHFRERVAPRFAEIGCEGLMMVRFVDNDDGYLAWIAQHTDGFVLNTERNPNPYYLRLHRATCWTITRLQPNARRWTTGDYIKICGSRTELESWARDTVGGTVQPCRLCT